MINLIEILVGYLSEQGYARGAHPNDETRGTYELNDSENYSNPPDFIHLITKNNCHIGFLIRDQKVTWSNPDYGMCGVIDFSNPDAVAIFQKLIDDL
jgi:hypothetical protein